jgi:hypothetical protein
MPGIFRPDYRPAPQRWIATAPAAAGTTVTVTAGSVTWAGQSVGISLTVTVTAGAASWLGQSVTPALTVPVVAASATWTGQTVTVTITSVSLVYASMNPVLVW